MVLYNTAVNNITVSDIYDVCIKLPGCGGTEAHLAECNLGNPVPEEITYGSIASATCSEFEQELHII